ncbi:hypothetical protein [Scytonema sp. PCC 10023]
MVSNKSPDSYVTIANARENLLRVERGEVTQRVDTSFRSFC